MISSVEELQTMIDNCGVIVTNDPFAAHIKLNKNFRIDLKNDILCDGEGTYWALDKIISKDKVVVQTEMDFDKIGTLPESDTRIAEVNLDNQCGEVVDPIKDLRSRVSLLEDKVGTLSEWVTKFTNNIIEPVYTCCTSYTPFTNDDLKFLIQFVDEKYNYLTRDEDGTLCFFESRPRKCLEKNYMCWVCDDGDISDAYLSKNLAPKLFPNIKWEDNEPCEFKKYLTVNSKNN